ncbi:MAG TPA: CbiX/SirB N-terminal domain-containing protein [Gemmatimonas sp.]|uniref:sirohydrochlorin chelatase n=1 Tax=Gemmatimonas sp. TaxID=1962908 RepID=UPI002ED825F0
MSSFRSTLRRSSATVVMGLAAMTLSATTLSAQAGKTGVVVVAHGGDSLWNALVKDAASKAKTDVPVEVSFLMSFGAAQARFQDAVAKLEAKGVSRIVVVPMLVSSHSGHYDQIRYLAGEPIELDKEMAHHLHMAGIEKPKTSLPIIVTPAMDNAPQVAQVLADRAKALAPNPKERALLIVGHGPNSAEDYASWMENLRQVADTVKAMTGFRDVRVELVRDDAPAAVRAEAVKRVRELIDLQQMATGKEVIVVPVLVSKGSVSRDKVPADIKGTPSVYSGEPLLPHDAMSRWVEMRVRDAGKAPAKTAQKAH